jgi:undecaprenyl diphosphate synthase
MQSTFSNPHCGLHAAIIMDGNGRWATARGLQRTAGHRAGADAVRRTVEAAPELGVRTLTLYAFSSDNWNRPPAEVGELMRLFRVSLFKETANCVKHGVRLSVIGRRDRLARVLRAAIEAAEAATAGGDALHVRLAVDYSSRDAILRAASLLRDRADASREEFAALLAEAVNGRGAVPDVDLLIRTGGEQRLSDFLLWECAYAELYFTKRLWPDFDADDLAAAVAEFHRRDRRFGRVTQSAAG